MTAIANTPVKTPSLSGSLALGMTMVALSLTACGNNGSNGNGSGMASSTSLNNRASASSQTANANATSTKVTPVDAAARPEFDKMAIATLDEPWAFTVIEQTGKPLTFLVTQKAGKLLLIDEKSNQTAITGVPTVDYGGQLGLGDVILAPDFDKTHDIYLSYAEAGQNNTRGAKVIRATLAGLDTATPSLTHIRPIWQQSPKLDSRGHFSHRLLISPDKQYLFISSGEMQQGKPAQDMTTNLGKMIRLNLDGSVPKDNPFASRGGVTAQIWTLGHRNLLGIAFDKQGNLWQHEMGPKGGDELNLIVKGKNYGWDTVSNGDNYDGTPIPDHPTRPEFEPPKVFWNPVISPSALAIYDKGTHDDFPAWQDKALISGLSSQSLMVVDLDSANQGKSARELYRYNMGQRMRSVRVHDGQVYMLEDGSNGKLIKLLPKR